MQMELVISIIYVIKLIKKFPMCHVSILTLFIIMLRNKIIPFIIHLANSGDAGEICGSTQTGRLEGNLAKEEINVGADLKRRHKMSAFRC